MDLMHVNSVRAGYLDLDGCTVVDLLPRQSLSLAAHTMDLLTSQQQLYPNVLRVLNALPEPRSCVREGRIIHGNLQRMPPENEYAIRDIS